MIRATLVLCAASALRMCGEAEAAPVVVAAAPPAVVAAPPVVAAAAAPPPARVPAPRHDGRVQVQGNYAVETVVAQTGDVAVYWTDLYGRPVTPAEVSLPVVMVEVGGVPRPVPVRVVGDHFVGHVDVALQPGVVVTMPTVAVRGVVLAPVVYTDVVIVPRMPVGVLLVEVDYGWHGHGHGHGYGWGRGHGRGRGHGGRVRFR